MHKNVIKIGRSIHPMQRLRELQAICPKPLRMLRVLYGDQEACLHARFAADCVVKDRSVGRELFRYSADIKAWLKAPNPDDMIGCVETLDDPWTTPTVRDSLPGWTGDDLLNFMHDNLDASSDEQAMPAPQIEHVNDVVIDWDAVFRGDVDYLRTIL